MTNAHDRRTLEERLQWIADWSEPGIDLADAGTAAEALDKLRAQAAEIERLSISVAGAEQRAVDAEHRLHSFRQSRAATSKALSEFIKARAPELWPDYAAVSVNKSVYSDDYVQEPLWEREMNILRHRAEKAEQGLIEARAALEAKP